MEVEKKRHVNEQDQEDEVLSGESDVKESGRVSEQDQEDKILFGEFRWMSRSCTLESARETCSVSDSSTQTPTQTGIKIVRIGDQYITGGDSSNGL